MNRNLISIVLVCTSFLLASLGLQWLGLSKSGLIAASQFQSLSTNQETQTISDGGLGTVSCRSDNLPEKTVLRCNTFVDSDFFLRMDIFEETEEGSWVQSIRLKLVPRLSDSSRMEAEERAIEFSGSEKAIRQFPIVTVSSGFLGLYTYSEYDVGAESLKALLASDLRKAASFYDRELTTIDVERLAQANAEMLENSLGSFSVRRDLTLMILQGSMEYVIFSLGLAAVLLLVWGVILEFAKRDIRGGRAVMSHSLSLGGALTYLGLLGTLIGMFGTVIELSAIDFVDEMRKVFDQTGSFGSMALAIGTSVVGLSGSVIVWLLHVIVSVVSGRRI